MGMTWNRLTYEDLMDNSFNTVSINKVIAEDNIIDFPVMGASNDANVEFALAA